MQNPDFANVLRLHDGRVISVINKWGVAKTARNMKCQRRVVQRQRDYSLRREDARRRTGSASVPKECGPLPRAKTIALFEAAFMSINGERWPTSVEAGFTEYRQLRGRLMSSSERDKHAFRPFEEARERYRQLVLPHRSVDDATWTTTQKEELEIVAGQLLVYAAFQKMFSMRNRGNGNDKTREKAGQDAALDAANLNWRAYKILLRLGSEKHALQSVAVTNFASVMTECEFAFEEMKRRVSWDEIDAASKDLAEQMPLDHPSRWRPLYNLFETACRHDRWERVKETARCLCDQETNVRKPPHVLPDNTCLFDVSACARFELLLRKEGIIE
jgi:hypothetical protein